MTTSIPAVRLIWTLSNGIWRLYGDTRMKARSRAPEPPYCWQNKEARRRIREFMTAADRWNEISSRLSLYDALCEESSNKGGESTFVVSQKILGDIAGLSARSVGCAIRDLVAAGLILAEDPKHGGRGMKTYTLLSVPSEAISERCEVTSEHCETTSERSEIDDSNPSFPSTEENIEVTREEKEKNNSSNGSQNRPSRKSPKKIQLVDDEHIRELKKIYQPRDVDKAVADCRAWLLTPRGKRKALTKSRLQTFLANAEPLIAEQGDNSTSSIKQIDRGTIDSAELSSYLAREHPAGLKDGWTPQNAPERVIEKFLKDRTAAA